MRVLFASLGGYGHLYTLVPLASACRGAGHEVSIATADDLANRARSWGFTTHAAGETFPWAWEEMGRRHPEVRLPEDDMAFGALMFTEVLAERNLEDLRPLLKADRPDLVVFEITDVGACVAATEAGIPSVGHGIGMLAEPFRAALVDHVPPLWRKAGFETPPFELPPGELFLDIWPEDLPAGPPSASAAERAQLRPVAWSDPASGVPPWVEEPHDRPLVFVSLGTVQFEMAELLNRVIEGLDALDVDALVLAGVGVELQELHQTDRIRAAGFVHQVGVLDRSDLVIHHAGAGTMLGALERALPALTLAAGADRPFNAMSLAASGAGLSLDPATATPAQITDAVRRLLEAPSFRRAAERVRATIEGMPSPEATVTRLEERVAARGGR